MDSVNQEYMSFYIFWKYLMFEADVSPYRSPYNKSISLTNFTHIYKALANLCTASLYSKNGHNRHLSQVTNVIKTKLDKYIKGTYGK